MLARLFVIIGGLFVLALTAALVGPHFVDWTSYRAEFEREATAILGRRVTVEGAVRARILPFPSVTFSNVVVAGNRPGAPAMTAETFSMDAELAPFLRGEVLIFDMRLVKPNVVIDIGTDGTVDWAVRPSAPFTAAQISLERLTVTDGRVTLRHEASGRTHQFSAIEAVVSARSFAGPWRADGTVDIDGTPTTLALSTGRVDDSGAMRLRLSADPAGKPVALETDGDVRLDKGALHYSGSFRLGAGTPASTAASTAPAAQGDGKPEMREGARPYRLAGRFAFNHERLEVSEFRFETGPADDPYTADGSASLDIGAEPHFDVEAKGAQVRFDDSGDTSAGGGMSLASRLAAVETALAALPRPSIKGSVDIQLPAVVAGDTTIRDVKVSADTAADGWAVKSFAATLPGRTTFEASGDVHTTGALKFTGEVLLAVAQPSGFAAWLSKEVDEAVRRLPAAGFRAHAELTAERQRFDGLELILGDAKFHGHIDRRQPANARPSMQFRLAGGALDLDGARAFASLFVSDQGVSRLADHDLDFAITAGPVTAAGLTADTVDTALRLHDGTLEIDRLSVGGLKGATVSATGTVKGFDNAPSGKFDVSLVSVDLAPLLTGLAEHMPDNALAREFSRRALAQPGLFEDSEIDIVASAAPNGDGSSGLAVSASGRAGGSDLSLTVSANGRPAALGDAELSIDLAGSNANAEALLGLYGIPTLPLGLLPAAETKFTAKGTLAGGMDTAIDLTGKDFQAHFNGRTTLWDDQLTAAGPVRIEAADIEPWLMSTGLGLPGMGFGLPVSLAAALDFRAGTLSLKDLKGTIEDGAVAGDLQIAGKEGVPNLVGALSLDQLEFGPLAALVLGEPALESKDGGWPKEPFKDGQNAPFSADLDLAVSSLSASPVLELSDVRMKARLDADGLRLSDLIGHSFDGTLSGLFELKNTDGTGLFSSQLKLDGADLETALPGAGLAGRVDVTAALSATGKSLEGMAAALSGSGTAALKGLTISGVNPDALPALIAAADEVGRDINSQSTASLAPPIVGAGSFSPKDAEFAFSVAGGVMRAPPLALASGPALMTADLRADASTGEIAVEGTIAYEPGDEKLAGSEPSLRFSLAGPPAATVRRFDTEPLAQFLTQRALEIEQARVEAMQAALLEKQRLRREVHYYAFLEQERERAADELRRAQEEMRRKAEEERQRKEEEAARQKAAAEDAARAKAVADEAARQKAAAEDAARQKAAAEDAAQAKAAADDAARAKAAADTAARARAAAEATAQAKASADAAALAKAAADAAQQAKAAAEDAARAKARSDEAVRAKAAAEAARRDDAAAAAAAAAEAASKAGADDLEKAREAAREAADRAAAHAAEAIDLAERQRARLEAERAAGRQTPAPVPRPSPVRPPLPPEAVPSKPFSFDIDKLLRSLSP